MLALQDLIPPNKNLGPNFQNFPKTFFKDLPMSDDLGIPRSFLIQIFNDFLCVSKEFLLFLSS